MCIFYKFNFNKIDYLLEIVNEILTLINLESLAKLDNFSK